MSPAYNSSPSGRSGLRRPSEIPTSVPRVSRGVIGHIARQRVCLIGHPLSLPTQPRSFGGSAPYPNPLITGSLGISLASLDPFDWDGMRARIYF